MKDEIEKYGVERATDSILLGLRRRRDPAWFGL
jgi:hypothetical protein